MNQVTRSKKQHGFFDLGISLIILAIGATTTAIVVSNHEKTVVAQNDTANTEVSVSYDE